MIKNDIQHKQGIYKTIIQMQNELEITLFFQLEYFKCIALI